MHRLDLNRRMFEIVLKTEWSMFKIDREKYPDSLVTLVSCSGRGPRWSWGAWRMASRAGNQWLEQHRMEDEMGG